MLKRRSRKGLMCIARTWTAPGCWLWSFADIILCIVAAPVKPLTFTVRAHAPIQNNSLNGVKEKTYWKATQFSPAKADGSPGAHS
jgi:hypothetical protein